MLPVSLCPRFCNESWIRNEEIFLKIMLKGFSNSHQLCESSHSVKSNNTQNVLEIVATAKIFEIFLKKVISKQNGIFVFPTNNLVV